MTKTSRLMLAVLAVCGTSAAMAQSSVTLYGRVNTSVEHQKLGNSKATGLVTNSSYIGFRGEEDLGGGLKAGFQLEGNFNSDDGSAGTSGFNFKRQSEVNLSGNFGKVRLGNFDPYSYSVTADWISMHNHDTGTSADMLYQGVLWGGNKIAYQTPTFGGFDAQIQYQFGEKAVEDNYENKGGWDLGLNYGNGPLGLGLGYSQAKYSFLGLGGHDDKLSQLAVRASYAIGDLTLGAYYQRQEEKHFVTAKRNVYRIAAMYTLGASEFHANVGQASKVKASGTSFGEKATQWTLAYNYNLSKRTKVYALYTNINNTESAFVGAPTAFSTNNTSASDKFRSIGVGVRHLF